MLTSVKFLTLKKTESLKKESIWFVDGAAGVLEFKSSSSDPRGRMWMEINYLHGLTFDNSVSIIDTGSPVYVNELENQLIFQKSGWQPIDHSCLKERNSSLQVLGKILNFSSRILDLPKVKGDTLKSQKGTEKLYIYHILFNSCCISVGICYLNQRDTNLKVHISISLENKISTQVRAKERQITLHLNSIEPNYKKYDHCLLYNWNNEPKIPIACYLVCPTIDVMLEDGIYAIVLAKLCENTLETNTNTISVFGNSYQIFTNQARDQELEEIRKTLFMDEFDD